MCGHMVFLPSLLLSLEDPYFQIELIQGLLSGQGERCSCLHWEDGSTAAALSCLSYTSARTEKSSVHECRHWSLIISVAATLTGRAPPVNSPSTDHHICSSPAWVSYRNCD